MNTSNLANTAKWQQMLAIVQKNGAPLPALLIRRFQRLSLSRLVAENVLVFLLQYIGLMLSTLTSFPAAAWLASGIASGWVFMRGVSVLPGIFLGSLLAYGMSFQFGGRELACASLFTLQAFFLLFFSFRAIRPTLVYYKQVLLFRFFVLAASLTAATSFLLQLLYFPNFILMVWLNTWLANLCGVMLFAFALNTLDAFFPQIEDFYQTKKSVVFIYGFWMTLSLIFVLLSHSVVTTLLSAFFLFIVINAISLRFGWCGSIASLFIAGFVLDLGVIAPAPFYTSHSALTMIIVLQLFLLMTSLTSISIGIKRLAYLAL